MDVQPNVLDQNCESRQALERIADKWTCLVVYALVDGPRRHGELRRAIDGISQRILTLTLRSLERDGLITRTLYRASLRASTTRPTRLGRTLSSPARPSRPGPRRIASRARTPVSGTTARAHGSGTWGPLETDVV